MDNITDISERFFEPCHIDEAVSPFLFREKRSASHINRFSTPVNKDKLKGSITTKENQKSV